MTTRFIARLDSLDTILSAGPHGVSFEASLAPLLQEATSESYFFSRVIDGDWFDVLEAGGVFQSVPSPVETSGGISFPYWPPVEALRALATSRPRDVSRTLAELGSTDNARLHVDFLDVAKVLPATDAAKISGLIERWIEQDGRLRYGDSLGEYALHLARGGCREETLTVLRAVLGLRVPEESPTYLSRGFPSPRIDAWQYERFLDKQFPEIAKLIGFGAFATLIDVFGAALHHVSQARGGRYDGSEAWFPRLDSDRPTYSETNAAIFKTARDVAATHLSAQPADLPTYVALLESKSTQALDRLALFLIGSFGEANTELLSEWVSRERFLLEIDLYPEFARLLETSFASASADAQASVIERIQRGPDEEILRSNLESWRGPLADEEFHPVVMRWRRDRLALIESFLGSEARTQYQELVEALGPAREIGAESDLVGGWVGPESPLNTESLSEMPVPELRQFLQDWTPDDDGGWLSKEGLSREFQRVFVGGSEALANLEVFLGVEPVYARAVVQGLTDLVKSGTELDWARALTFCEWVVAQTAEIEPTTRHEASSGGSWSETQKAVGWLLQEGLQTGDTALSLEHRSSVWAVIEKLLEHPDPSSFSEDGSTLEPATLAINTVRGIALHLAVRYGLWVKRFNKGMAFEAPELMAVLERHLDVRKDPALSIRSVYGQFFPWIQFLDPEWANGNVRRIFPYDDEGNPYFDVAWSTFLALSRPYNDVFEPLQPCYRKAVEALSEPASEAESDSDRRLGEHLMAYYWRGLSHLWRDGLIARFFELAPDASRAQAIRIIGRFLANHEGEVPTEILDRLRDLWEHRLHRVRTESDRRSMSQEIGAFSTWVDSRKFPAQESLARFRMGLLLMPESTEAHYNLPETLVESAATEPVEALETLQALLFSGVDHWWVGGETERVRVMLEGTLKSPETRPLSEAIVDTLVRFGFLHFRDLVTHGGEAVSE